MKSPADMKIIQIDITNACTKRCSNCTRFCGNHRKPFMMDFDTFKRAVDSMAGFPGIVGIMGGEPTLHPQFEEFVRYFAANFGQEGVLDNARQPVVDFNAHIVRNVFDIDYSNRRGLWSILGKRYYEHYELIQEIFGYQAINDHANPSEHAALLITRKELGIPDDEWVKMRDACWIQNLWSASITPKGAFFCEVAAALDATFNGPGGWPIEPGWWKRKPEDFKEQLQWCEMCSACLKVPSRNANDEIDDVSPAIYQKLVEIRSPKIKQNLINIVEVGGDATGRQGRITGRTVQSNTWYLPDSDQSLRIGPTNKTIYPKRFDGLVMCESDQSLLEGFLPLRGQFDDVVVVAPEFSAEMRARLESLAITPLEGKYFQTWGDALNAALSRLQFSDWCVLVNPDVAVPQDLVSRLREVVLNPGSLYFNAVNASCEPNQISAEEPALPAFLMFNALAQSLRSHLPAPFPVEGGLGKFLDFWPARKRIALLPDFDATMPPSRADAIDQVFETIRGNYAWIANVLPPSAGQRILRLGRWAHATTKRVHRYIRTNATRRP
ncbi:MAG: hypothetical protein J5X22_19305 [Candidatus Accumulibacter sp.]|uniref:radical SAM protein n=1 Tax=Accumulibacter sp. TaxID=2053492 RepID=UPI001AC01726|nr:radical SAM protein [Accumulibacter sp.]MBN8517266.1 hypothetical protein [Accumulibacter sp.]MBO3712561.1 hypothetical protein [Accumulibacter sp.]